ncbi:hypothetical protein [Brevibacillus formosus]|uniref:hypothetical protein n=1 Tax=Brevibacillus formosus TaxID=54913 RepID=UPI003F1C8888
MNKVERNFFTGMVAVGSVAMVLFGLYAVWMILSQLWEWFGSMIIYSALGLVVAVVGVYYLGAFINRLTDDGEVKKLTDIEKEEASKKWMEYK